LIGPKPFLKGLFAFVLVLRFLGSSLATDNAVPPSQGNLVVKGTLVCIGKQSKEVPCAGTGNTLGLRAATGQIYLLKNDKSSETLLDEKRLRSRDFQLTLKKSADSDSYEIVKSQFFRDGKLYDFYYFCDICNITTHTPGLCMCCRQETEYHEKLAE
jgi:hypothetical protein